MDKEKQEKLNKDLMNAIQNDNLNEATKLISLGSSLVFESKTHMLKEYRHLLIHKSFEIIKLFVENNNYSKDANVLSEAAFRDRLDVVKYLIERGDDYSVNNYSVLRACVKKNNLSIVKYLTEKGVHNTNFLLSTVIYRNVSLFKYLIDQEYNIYEDDNEIIKKIAVLGIVDMFEYLIDKKKVSIDFFSTIPCADNIKLSINQYKVKNLKDEFEMILPVKEIDKKNNKIKI